MSVGWKFKVIQKTLKKNDNQLNVTMLCDIAGVSRSGYYRITKNLFNRKFTEYVPRKVLLTDILIFRTIADLLIYPQFWMLIQSKYYRMS